jgi:hypothetical protein
MVFAVLLKRNNDSYAAPIAITTASLQKNVNLEIFKCQKFMPGASTIKPFLYFEP